MKKFDPEKNMIDLQGFELSYMPATPHCGGYTESLACSQFLVFPFMDSFVFKQQVLFRVDFFSVTLDHRVQCPRVRQGVKI